MDERRTAQEVRDYLENFQGEYDFDFTKEGDCAYFLEEFGGKEKLKEEYPEFYSAFASARRGDLLRSADSGADENQDCSGSLGTLCLVKDDGKGAGGVKNGREISDTFRQGDQEEYGRLWVDFSCDFIDVTRQVCDEQPAQPWKGVTIQAKIRDRETGEEVVNSSFVVPETNSYTGTIKSSYARLSELNNREYTVRIQVTGKRAGDDETGRIRSKIFQKTESIGTVELCTIKNIIVDDPSPKNDAHVKSKTIMMLYGRTDQQQIYKLADYSGGDFYNNTFDSMSNVVHLLMPIKGTVMLNTRVKPVGLKPQEGNWITRPKASYDYKQQEFLYRRDIGNAETLYNRLKDNFVVKGVPENGAEIDFDFELAEKGRSVYDWHDDVRGIQNGEAKNIMLKGAFTYLMVNQLGAEVEETIRIISAEEKDLPEMHAEYYKYDSEKHRNTIYIPPIQIYWGCHAKTVQILMADGTKKEAGKISVGDKVAGRQGRILTIAHVLSGYEEEIYRINTRENGDILVSGGHPMLCGGETVRVLRLAKGDKLDCADGTLAEIAEVRKELYKDLVYNYTFEEAPEGEYLIANGFYSGDLYLQNKKDSRKKTELNGKELAFIKEMQRLAEVSADKYAV